MKIKKHDYILIAVCVITVIITFMILGTYSPKKQENVVNSSSKAKLLNNYSRFFTIESCMYRFISYIQDNQVDSLLKVLDEDYIEKNAINKDNVLEFVGSLEGFNTFTAKKIYYNDLNDNMIEYYVYGQIVSEAIDTYSYYGVDRYYIVVMDTENMTYSVEPIDKSLFSEVSNG